MSLHNNPSDASAYTRREFMNVSLKGALLASAAGTVPGFLTHSAMALPTAGAGMVEIPGVDTDRVLVVVQLSGGNDGLNTVAPFGLDEYRRMRPQIGLREEEVLRLDRRGPLGLHRAMEGIKGLYDEGLVGIVQGVGYPNPNRSHFKSMDIWHTGDTSGTGNGWLARYIDSQCCGFGAGEGGQAEVLPEPGIAIGRTAPLAMDGGQIKPVAFENANLFRWMGRDVHEALGGPYERMTRRDPGEEAPMGRDFGEHTGAADFLMRTAMNAQVAGDQIRDAVSRRSLVEYPGTNLGRQLQMVGSMIRAGLKTRVYYVSHGGFDTHAGQGGAFGQHANLLTQFSEAVSAFIADMRAQGNDQRVLTMSFSEFGRRVGQNGSGGTDHGTAAPMFLLGPMVKPGLGGKHPSLTDLDNGDLKYTTDFRTVYSAVLENWLQTDASEVLGKRYRAAKVLRG